MLRQLDDRHVNIQSADGKSEDQFSNGFVMTESHGLFQFLSYFSVSGAAVSSNVAWHAASLRIGTGLRLFCFPIRGGL
jgi:hypothetical protein